jgi:hypothetical protein
MALARFQRALALTLAARDAAIAGDGERCAALLDERAPLIAIDDVAPADRDQVRAILVEIQRQDAASIELLGDELRLLAVEHAAFRRSARAAAAYIADPQPGDFYRTG